MVPEGEERLFSIEMKSKEHVKSLTISDEIQGRVLFEGRLGELEGLGIIDSAVLEVRGSNGVVRLELSEGEIRGMLSPGKEER
jgi:hypothetical protein